MLGDDAGGQGPHLAKRWEPRGFSRVAAAFSSYDGDLSLPLGLALADFGMETLPSGVWTMQLAWLWPFSMDSSPRGSHPSLGLLKRPPRQITCQGLIPEVLGSLAPWHHLLVPSWRPWRLRSSAEPQKPGSLTLSLLSSPGQRGARPHLC